MPSAAMSSGSSPRKIWYVANSPSSTPSRTTLRPSHRRRARSMISGSMKSTTKFGWPLACETIGGANAASAPPAAAAQRLRTRRRRISQYQVQALAAMPRVRTRAKVTVSPKTTVTGMSGTFRPSIVALAIRFTPSGMPWAVVKSGLRRWVMLSVATPTNHSHWFWSWSASRR